jgi:hypothetical protein
MTNVDVARGSDPGQTAFRPETSVIERAVAGDRRAMDLMFRAFVPPGEPILVTEYLGIRGFFGLGSKSFGCVTEARASRIELGLFGEVIYQEALIRDINSVVIHQPSRLWLYVILAGVLLAAIPTMGLALLALPLVPRLYYRFAKSGAVFGVREGIPLYLFTDRARLTRLRSLLNAINERRIGLPRVA